MDAQQELPAEGRARFVNAPLGNPLIRSFTCFLARHRVRGGKVAFQACRPFTMARLLPGGIPACPSHPSISNSKPRLCRW